MKRSILATLLVCLALLAFLVVRGPAIAREQAQAAHQQWEYVCYMGNPTVTKEFDKLGAQGWEICGTYPGDSVHKHLTIFKRPKR